VRLKRSVESLVTGVASTDIAAIEGELSQLERRRAQLAESLDAATNKAIQISAERRDLIIANRDRQTLHRANSKVREAEEQRVALDDALHALEEKIAEITKRLEEAKAQADRNRIAQLLEQEADAVDKATSAVEKAAKQLGGTYEQLRSAMSAASILQTLDRRRLAEDRVAGLITAEALAAAAPDLFATEPGDIGVSSILRRGFSLGNGVVRFETRDQEQLAESSGAHAYAEHLLTSRLRAKAAAIRAGDEPAVFPSAPSAPVEKFARRPELRHVLFLEPVRYLGRGGQPVIHAAWTARVPAPVAKAAIKQGLALDADTDAGRAKMKEMAEHRRRVSRRLDATITVEDTIDLGVNLAEELEVSENAA
jgi:molecular chaperone GrpE (heat shock protein)